MGSAQAQVFDQLAALEAPRAIAQRPRARRSATTTGANALVVPSPRLSTLADTIARLTRRVLVVDDRFVRADGTEFTRLAHVFHQGSVRVTEHLDVGDAATSRRARENDRRHTQPPVAQPFQDHYRVLHNTKGHRTDRKAHAPLPELRRPQVYPRWLARRASEPAPMGPRPEICSPREPS